MKYFFIGAYYLVVGIILCRYFDVTGGDGLAVSLMCWAVGTVAPSIKDASKDPEEGSD